MAKIDESELGADFNYILRLADSDVDGLTRIGMGLTSVKGVGVRTALQICKIAEVDKDKLGGHLTDEEQEKAARLDACDARYEVFHFEQMGAIDDEEGFLDPGALLMVLEQLAELCDGVVIDPQSGGFV